MSFLTFDKLLNRPFQKAQSINENRGLFKTSDKVVFLSYRRKDRQWVIPVVDFLQSLGVRIYIDYLDDELPDEPNSKTAAILRKRIKDSDKFVVMATPNSKESRWIPWEMGLGDGFDGYENTIVLPLTQYSKTWHEQEYYRIYGFVQGAVSKDKKRNDWAVFYPNGSAVWLNEWLSK